MNRDTFTVPKISCGHCAAAIERELNDLDGVSHVAVDILAKRVSVEWNPPASSQAIREALDDAGYPAA